MNMLKTNTSEISIFIIRINVILIMELKISEQNMQTMSLISMEQMTYYVSPLMIRFETLIRI